MAEQTATQVERSDDVGRPRFFRALLTGGLTVGVLDILDAITFSWVRSGIAPQRILQSVASGLLGRPAYDGGWKTAVLGLLLHLVIAFVVVATYIAISRRFPILIKRAVLFGLIYGVLVYFVMSYVVLPLSAFPRRPGAGFALVPFLNGVIGHALLVGLPAALSTRASARR